MRLLIGVLTALAVQIAIVRPISLALQRTPFTIVPSFKLSKIFA